MRERRALFELIADRVTLNNPVMAASGTFGYGVEFAERGDLSDVGAVVCKGITVRAQAGHSPPRILATAGGALNAIGLANVGMERAIHDLSPRWANLPTPIIVNINGDSVADLEELAAAFDPVQGVAALEINVSCPNTAKGGMLFGVDPTSTGKAVAAVRAKTQLPLIVKLTPTAQDIVAVARAAVDAGAECLTVANTYPGMAIDIGSRAPALSNVTGGLSGPAIKPLALRLVYEVSAAAPVPVIGGGGIMNGRDAVEYLMAGARALQVGTASLVDPFAVPRIANELASWIEQQGCTYSDVIGSANPGFRPGR